jgi:hypothetical protein
MSSVRTSTSASGSVSSLCENSRSRSSSFTGAASAVAGAASSGWLSSEMMRRIEARISSMEGSWASFALAIDITPPDARTTLGQPSTQRYATKPRAAHGDSSRGSVHERVGRGEYDGEIVRRLSPNFA